MKLYYLDITMPFDVLCNAVHSEIYICSDCRRHALLSKGNRAVVLRNIHFNRVCGSKVLQDTIEMLISSSDVVHEESFDSTL